MGELNTETHAGIVIHIELLSKKQPSESAQETMHPSADITVDTIRPSVCFWLLLGQSLRAYHPRHRVPQPEHWSASEKRSIPL